MKLKALFLSLVLLMSGYMFAQQVDRENVLLEIVTGTWCYYCPGAAMGAEDLVANGKQVAVIEYHTGDNYQNTYSAARSSYYNVSGVPSAFFDGVLSVVGGSHTQSMYGSYLPKYNQRINIPSDFTIEATGTNAGMVEYDFNVTVTKVATNNSSNLKLMCAITESNIPQSWQGMDHLEWVERTMLPNQNGTALDFSSVNTQNVSLSFTMEPGWVSDNCEVVFFVQDLSSKEVFQAVKYDLSEFSSTNDYDVSLKAVYVPMMVCNSSITPKVKIANYGLVTLTSADITYSVNGGATQTYTWTGSLEQMESEIVELPAIDATVLEDNTFEATVDNPNGQPDQYTANNSKTVDFEMAEQVGSQIALLLKLDDNPEETSWEVKDDNGTVLYSGSQYTTPGQTVIEYLDFTQSGCYTFNIFDDAGNGLEGSGIFKLVKDGSTVFAQGNDFGDMASVEFSVNITGDDEMAKEQGFSVFPNPFTNNTNVRFSVDDTQTVSLNVFNTVGEKVYSVDNKKYTAGSHEIQIDAGNMPKGIYYLNLKIGDKVFNEKLVLTK